MNMRRFFTVVSTSLGWSWSLVPTHVLPRMTPRHTKSAIIPAAETDLVPILAVGGAAAVAVGAAMVAGTGAKRSSSSSSVSSSVVAATSTTPPQAATSTKPAEALLVKVRTVTVAATHSISGVLVWRRLPQLLMAKGFDADNRNVAQSV